MEVRFRREGRHGDEPGYHRPCPLRLYPSQKVIALERLRASCSGSSTPDRRHESTLAWPTGRMDRKPHLRRCDELSLRIGSGHRQAHSNGFGEAGRIDLRKDLRGDYKSQSIALTSPAVIYKDLIIVGGPESGNASCATRRYTRLRCSHRRVALAIRHYSDPGESGYDTWPENAWRTAGAANNWARHDSRCGARHCLCSDRLCGAGFLWRRRLGNDSVCRHATCSSRRDRQAHLALPGCASRFMGPGFSFRALIAHSSSAWQEH